MSRPPTIFLLSPADLKGVRAKQLTSSRAKFAAAQAYRSPDGVAIADAFSFMSALYFRGKIAYARHFASPQPEIADGGIFVITPGFGLVAPEWRIDVTRMKRLRRVDVDPRSRAYRRPLERDAIAIAQRAPDARVILLGSIATDKYVDVLWPIFGERLLFPRQFVGVGDMSRGALMLRAVREERELEYAPLTIERHVKRPKKPQEAVSSLSS